MPENPDTVEFLPELTDREKAAVLDELYTDHDWREEHFVDEAYELAMRWNPSEAERLTREVRHDSQVRRMNRRAQEVADNVNEAMRDIFGETIRDDDLPALMRRRWQSNGEQFNDESDF